MKQRTKRSFALLLAMAMVFSLAGVFGGCGEEEHVCGHVCPTCQKCLDENCTDPVCAEKCEGHTAVEPHECGHVCPTCGKCLDETCTDPVCAEKCEGHAQDEDPTREGTFTPIISPVAGKYYMGMKCSGDVYYYVKGGMSGFYMATSSNQADAAVVTLIEDDGGWLLKLGDQYMEIEISGTHVNAVYKASRTAGKNWTWDSTYNIFTWENGTYFYGTYGTYNTVGGGEYAQHASDNYKAQLGLFIDPNAEKPAAESVTLDRSGEYIILPWVDNNYFDIKATVLPVNASQDVTWSISENTAGITVNKGRVLCGKTEGEATVTATATGTDKTASVKVKVGAVNGSTEEDPLSVDEAIALMTEEGKEIAAGYSQNILRGFYLTGTVENSKFTAKTGDVKNAYWTFDMAGTNGKKLTCMSGNVGGVLSQDGKLDGYTVVLSRAKLKLSGTTYTAGNVDDLASSVSATPPAVTSIVIDATAEVNMPVQTKINVTQVLPANAKLDGTEVWKTGDESKATVEGGMVTGVSAGEVKIWVEVGSVKSNECTVTVIAPAAENQLALDWTGGFTADTVCDGTTLFIITPTADKLMEETVNKWTPGQTEITALSIEGKVNTAYDISGFGFYPGKKAASGTLSFTTQHQIKKLTIKYIAYATGTQVEFTVNGQKYHQDKIDDKWDGKVASVIEAEIELSEATNNITIESLNDKTSQFAIVGITLEW